LKIAGRVACFTVVSAYQPTLPNLQHIQRGYAAMIRVAKAMALTAYDLLTNPEALAAAKSEFAGRREK
jgi:hypothetical protein